jgi:hypothetical protein
MTDFHFSLEANDTLNVRFRRPYGDDWSDDRFTQGFIRRLNAQVDDNHRRVSEANHTKRQIGRRAPAMDVAGLLALEPENEFEYAALNDEVMRLILEEPITDRYINYLESSDARRHPNTEWWHAFGHQKLATLTVLNAVTREDLLREDIRQRDIPIAWDARMFPKGAESSIFHFGPAEASFEWAGRMMEAQTYLWHQDVLEAAVAAPLPAHVIQPNALPFEAVFFSFEMAAWVEMSDIAHDEASNEEVQARSETWWCLISKVGDAGIMLTFSMQIWPNHPYQPQEHIVMEPIAWDMRWPEDFEKRRFKAQIGAVLRMLAFMQAPFVDASLSSRRLPRPIRREYDRQGKPAPEREVSVVTLRRALNEPVYPQAGEATAGREFKHSWWVSGHYRWQYYPSEKTHRLIAIAPFIKQAGKPMLKKLYDVAR